MLLRLSPTRYTRLEARYAAEDACTATLALHLVHRPGGTGAETGDFDQLLFQFSRGLRRPLLSSQNRMHGVDVSSRDFFVCAAGRDGRPGDYGRALIRNRGRIGEFSLLRAVRTSILFIRLHQG